MFSNECIFFLQLFLIGILLLFFLKEKYSNILECVLIYILIFLNLLSHYEVILFGIHCSVVEPLTIAAYFITMYLYLWNKEKINNILQNMYYIHFFLCSILFIISFYKISYMSFSMNSFIYSYIWNTFISLVSFKIAYQIECYAYQNVLFIENPYRQSISVMSGQLFDTIFYTLFVFYNRSYFVIFNVIFFSYIIKLICIILYTFFLKLNTYIFK